MVVLPCGRAAAPGSARAVSGSAVMAPVTAPGRADISSGTVTDAVVAEGAAGVTAGVTAVVGAVAPRTLANVCMNWAAAAGFAASCCRKGRPGTSAAGAGAGAGTGAGSAAAEVLSANAVEAAAAAAIIVVVIIFPVRCMNFSQIP